MDYRREIDGLRALAVTPVILFHAGFAPFSGGFVGVDVFFVISGYLITTILITDLIKGDFSLINFYERRARRILPALFFVSICCIPFAYAWMLPSQLKDFSESLVAVVLFLSNVLFWRETGYFSPSAELKPLLHTWSLAVEEQFYLFFPVFLLLIWRLGRNFSLFCIVLVAVLSLLLSEYAWRHFPSANFYLAPTRAWELFVGAIVAFASFGTKPRYSEFLGAAGLIMVLGSIFLFTESTPFPSAYTLVPVMGTALVVMFSRHGTWSARVLSHPILVSIGLISYSAYLWHQPLFAFARLRSLTEPSALLMGVLVILTFALAFLTWRWVEQPFRKTQQGQGFSRQTVFGGSLGVGCVILLVGLTGYLGEGFRGRGNGEVNFAELDARVAINNGLSPDCELIFNSSPNCFTSLKPEVLLWGDSFAMHLSQGILASAEDVAMQQHTKSVCSPVLGLAAMRSTYSQEWARGCIEFNSQVMDWLRQNDSVRLVVLSSPFSQLLEGHVLTERGEILIDPPIKKVVDEIAATAEQIRRTGARVLIVSPTPQSGWDTGQCLVRSEFFKATEDSCDFILREETKAELLLREVEKGIPVHWLHQDICATGVCDVMQEGVFIFRDEGHLSQEGSAYLGQRNGWITAFREIAN